MNREELLAVFKQSAEVALKPKAVTVKGLGQVYVRPLTVAEVDEQNSEIDQKSKTGLARGAARLLCDENGKRLLDPNNEADVKALSALPWSQLRQLLQASDDDIKGELEEKK